MKRIKIAKEIKLWFGYILRRGVPSVMSFRGKNRRDKRKRKSENKNVK